MTMSSNQPDLLLKNLSFNLEELLEIHNLNYDQFKGRIREIISFDSNNLKKKMVDEIIYPHDSVRVMIPVIENDLESYELKTFSSLGGFTRGQLLYKIAGSLKEFTGGFANDWFHVFDGLIRQDCGSYKLTYNVYI